jgi:hypothetical protein
MGDIRRQFSSQRFIDLKTAGHRIECLCERTYFITPGNRDTRLDIAFADILCSGSESLDGFREFLRKDKTQETEMPAPGPTKENSSTFSEDRLSLVFIAQWPDSRLPMSFPAKSG